MRRSSGIIQIEYKTPPAMYSYAEAQPYSGSELQQQFIQLQLRTSSTQLNKIIQDETYSDVFWRMQTAA